MMRKIATRLAQLFGLLWLFVWAFLHLREAAIRPIPAIIAAAVIFIAFWFRKVSSAKSPDHNEAITRDRFLADDL